MCGIVGVVGRVDAAPRLLEGLRRLEYRGYDSAGVATLVDGAIARRRAEGKLDASGNQLGDATVIVIRFGLRGACGGMDVVRSAGVLGRAGSAA